MKQLAYLMWMVWGAHLVPLFFGIGEGPSKAETNAQSALQGTANYATSTGENATNQSTNFWSSILSGDMSKIMQVLGPQITAIKNQGQQIKQTASQFGNRSGGTNATLQNVDDNTRTAVNNLISSLTGAAATNLGNEGLSLLNTGAGANVNSFNEAKTIQQQKAAKWGDIFGSIAKIAAPFFAPAAGAASAAGGLMDATVPFTEGGAEGIPSFLNIPGVNASSGLAGLNLG